MSRILQEYSRRILGILKEYTENNLTISQDCFGNIRGTLQEYSRNFPTTPQDSKNSQGILHDFSRNILTAFWKYTGNTLRTFEEYFVGTVRISQVYSSRMQSVSWEYLMYNQVAFCGISLDIPILLQERSKFLFLESSRNTPGVLGE